MAYRRRRNYRRYRRKKGSYAKRMINKYTSPGSVANKALHLARRVAKMVNAEYKFFDVNEAAVQVNWSGYLPGLCTPTQGLGDSQREGDSIKMQNLVFRGTVQRAAADQEFRLIILIDKQAKVASLSDVLEVTGSVYSPISPKTYDRRFQTKILYDHRYYLTADKPTVDINLTIPIREHQQFSGGTTTPTTGKLLAIFVSNTNTLANEPTITYYSRCTYTDN